jgi:hypothetical protein
LIKGCRICTQIQIFQILEPKTTKFVEKKTEWSPRLVTR